MPATNAQAAWVERVLGYGFVRRSSRRLVRKPPSAFASIRGREIWRAAREKVGAEIGALCVHLSGTTDPELQRIATFGLNGATGKLSVSLLVALSEADAATADQRPVALAKARDLIGDYRSFLQQNRLVRLLDENPFGVTVSIRATLGAALTAIDQALAA
jgi:hypothetical protein